MNNDEPRPFTAGDTLYPTAARIVRRVESVALVVGVVCALILAGLRQTSDLLHWELALIVVAAMFLQCVGLAFRYQWSLAKRTFGRTHFVLIGFLGLWMAGVVAIGLYDAAVPLLPWAGRSKTEPLFVWSELMIVLRGLMGVVQSVRSAAGRGFNPAVVLVLSFAFLVTVGTFLLLLPRSRAESRPLDEPWPDRIRIALFTATSASCVTGLTVVPTGGAEPYWSRIGQVVILGLFQIGGLGIMTFGAFFAVAAGRGMQIRESATLRELLESETLGNVRRLVLAILAFTLVTEGIGAILLSTLWPERPWGERAFMAVFHSVSAFCNAGFSLTGHSFEGMGLKWQVWGVVAGEIIIGGLGFAVLYNVVLAVRSRWQTFTTPPLFDLPTHHVRLTVSTRLALLATGGLLVAGTLGYYLLEASGPRAAEPAWQRLAEAWFQSVTFRTAGFSTVDHGQLQPATKLFAVTLMFVGASPGSTGGGVKTVAFAVTILSLVAILRNRNRVEVFGRRIPDAQVHRALAIIALGLLAVMTTTILLVLFEQRPERFIDHLYEAASAFGTVGVSSSVEVAPGQRVATTATLSPPSQLILVVTMFVGRVGPLTLLLALAGRKEETRYDYPIERVTLG